MTERRFLEKHHGAAAAAAARPPLGLAEAFLPRGAQADSGAALSAAEGSSNAEVGGIFTLTADSGEISAGENSQAPHKGGFCSETVLCAAESGAISALCAAESGANSALSRRRGALPC